MQMIVGLNEELPKTMVVGYAASADVPSADEVRASSEASEGDEPEEFDEIFAYG